MTTVTGTRLTSRQRIGRGLAHTASGPVDITRGAVGITAQSVAATAGALRRRYRTSRLRADLQAASEVLAREFAEAQDTVAALPQTIADAAKPEKSRRGRRLMIFGAAGVLLAGGAAAFALARRTGQPEPATLAPSVPVAPKP